MGIVTSNDSRRISFENNFRTSPIILQKVVQYYDESDLKKENISEALNVKTSLESINESGDYWAHRIEYLQNEHHAINKIVEEEFQNTIRRNSKLLNTSKVPEEKIKKSKPCFEWQSKILKCYEDNPHQPLVCSGIVKEFKRCVMSCQMEE